MAAAKIGTCWADASWSDTTWEAGTWANVTVVVPSSGPNSGSGPDGGWLDWHKAGRRKGKKKQNHELERQIAEWRRNSARALRHTDPPATSDRLAWLAMMAELLDED